MQQNIYNVLKRNNLNVRQVEFLTNFDDGSHADFIVTEPDSNGNCYMVSAGLGEYLTHEHETGIAYEVAIKLSKACIYDTLKLALIRNELENLVLQLTDLYEFTQDYTYYTIESNLSTKKILPNYCGYVFKHMLSGTKGEPNVIQALPMDDEEISYIWSNDVKPSIAEKTLSTMYPDADKTDDFCIDVKRKIDFDKYCDVMDVVQDGLPIEETCYMYMFEVTETNKYKTAYDKCMAYLKGEF